MDIKKLKSTLQKSLGNYKYVILVFLIGAVLMILPPFKASEKKQASVTPVSLQNDSVQEELEKILTCVKGVGKVKVMLKEISGAETIYQTNQDVSVSDNGSNTSVEVITVTDSQRNEQGLIKQVNPAKYAGAIILCQGADDPAVKLAVTEAVSKITGLKSDKIAVLKMK